MNDHDSYTVCGTIYGISVSTYYLPVIGVSGWQITLSSVCIYVLLHRSRYYPYVLLCYPHVSSGVRPETLFLVLSTPTFLSNVSRPTPLSFTLISYYLLILPSSLISYTDCDRTSNIHRHPFSHRSLLVPLLPRPPTYHFFIRLWSSDFRMFGLVSKLKTGPRFPSSGTWVIGYPQIGLSGRRRRLG